MIKLLQEWEKLRRVLGGGVWGPGEEEKAILAKRDAWKGREAETSVKSGSSIP